MDWAFLILFILIIAAFIVTYIVNKIKEPTEEKQRLVCMEADAKERLIRAQTEKEKCDRLIEEYQTKLVSVINREKIAKEKEHAAAVEENRYISCRSNLVQRYNIAKQNMAAEIDKKADEKANKRVDDLLKERQMILDDLIADTNKKRDYLNHQLTPNINLFLPVSQFERLQMLQQSVLDKRFFYAFESKPKIRQLSFEAQIQSSTTGEIYHTTLDRCTCKDFQFNRKGEPCKHILYLAYVVGLFQINQKLQEAGIQKINNTLKKEQELDSRIKKQQQEIKLQNDGIKELQNTKENLESLIEELKNDIKNIINEKTEAYPRLAGLMADLLTLHYEKSASLLETKKNPALIEAARIRELKNETREILKDKKVLEYKIAYIEALFPNIVDIFDSDFQNDEDFTLETDETTDRTRNFLSHEEFSKLSVRERNQLALDRYVQGEKTKWQIGRDYEMYIGQQFESHGFTVKYTGIIENIEDMGRDLICNKDGITYIVQCKNWSQEKEIHEKHIFQLFGTVVLRQIETPSEIVVGVFVTTTDLSAKAKSIAKHLNIIIYPNTPLQEFRRIKCNVNKATGEKIYHLPFDQKYDRTQIEKKNGEFFASTVEEAEDAGFRRAWKHFGE